MTVEDGRMNHLQGQRGPAAGRERGIVAAYPGIDRAQARFGAFAQAGQQIVGRLRVIEAAGQPLKAEQIHGLLVQLVQSGAAKLAGRLQERGKGDAHRSGLLQPFQHQAQRQRRGVGGDHGWGIQIRCSRLRAQQWSAHHNARLLIQSARKVEYRRAGT